MINQVTVEALHSANYVENYLDSVENLPDDVQRHLSRIREIDVLYRNHLRDVSIYYEQWNGANGTTSSAAGHLNGGGGAGSDSSSTAATPATDQLSQATKRAIVRMQQGLIAAQELGDEKLQIVQHLQDLIDHKTRQLDQDFKNLGSDFFSRLDYGREEKLSAEQQQQKEIRTNSPGSVCSPNISNANANTNAISSPSAAFAATSTGTAGSCANGENSSLGGASGGYSSGGANANSNNGGASGGNGSGTAGSGGIGAGSGNSGNGNGGTERGSKRARRTRNEQTGGSANNGSSTPNSTSGAMEVDPIDTSNIKQEDAGGQSSGGNGGGGGATGSGGSSSGKAGGSSAAGEGNGGVGGSGSGAGSSGQSTSGGQGKKGAAAAGGKKKKRKTGGRGQAREAREDTPPPEETIDPDEPTYCLCDQISFGEMILCDNDLCPIEWFHFSCVALMSKPKGKWFCPNCRGDRPNVMKPKAQFLKELERYNKEKEEKT